MFSAAIVDDCPQDGCRLEEMLTDYCTRHPLRMTTRRFLSGEDFLKAHGETAFQLVFLDIYLGGENGMEVARQLRQKDSRCLIVFISSGADFAVESYRVRAHDYLLKPFDQAAFDQAMSLCDATLRRGSLYIEVKEGRLYRHVPLDDILYTDYANHYIQIHLKEGVVKTYMPFSAFEELLGAHPRFICCYRNIMVNMDWIARMDEKDFVLRNDKRVPIARHIRTEVRQRYADYAFDRGGGTAWMG